MNNQPWLVSPCSCCHASAAIIKPSCSKAAAPTWLISGKRHPCDGAIHQCRCEAAAIQLHSKLGTCASPPTFGELVQDTGPMESAGRELQRRSQVPRDQENVVSAAESGNDETSSTCRADRLYPPCSFNCTGRISKVRRASRLRRQAFPCSRWPHLTCSGAQIAPRQEKPTHRRVLGQYRAVPNLQFLPTCNGDRPSCSTSLARIV